MANTTGLTPELLWPGIMSIFGTTYKSYEPLYSKYMQVDSSDKQYEQYQGLTALPLASVKNQGGNLSYADMNSGFMRRILNVTYALGATATFEMMKFDQYREIMRLPEHLASSYSKTQETVCANLLNNGFATAAANVQTLAADGLSLFNASHLLAGDNGTTFRNTPATASDLTMTALEQAYIDLGNLVDDWGQPIVVRPKILHVPVEEQHTARKILETEYAVGSANNDVNVVSSAMVPLQLIVNPYLTDVDAWFLHTDQKDGIVMTEALPAQIDRDNDFETKNLRFSVMGIFGVGAADPRGAYGSPGT